MHELTTQYLSLIENNFYFRERRKYKTRSRGPRRQKVLRPNTTIIKPKKEDEIYGPRTGFADRIQGIYGYFYGGGWAFGSVENSIFRVTTDSFRRYESMKANQETEIVVTYRAGDPSGEQTGEFDLDQPNANLPDEIPTGTFLLAKKTYAVGYKGADLPYFEDLTPIDQWAVIHDRMLRQRNQNIWDGVWGEGSIEAKEAFEEANFALKVRIDALDWGQRKRWLVEDKKEFPDRGAYRHAMSMLAYQKVIGEFSAFILSFVSSNPENLDKEFLQDPVERISGQLRIPRTSDQAYDDWKAVRRAVEFEFTIPKA